jgi:histone H2B
VVKTKVVKETVQVATTIIPDSSESLPDTQPEPEVVDVQRSTDVQVELVTTPDVAEPPSSAKKAKRGGQDAGVKSPDPAPEPPTSAKKAKRGGQDAGVKSPKPPVVVPVSVESQETQEDPNSYQDQPEKTAPAGDRKKPQAEEMKPAPEGPETPRQKKPKRGGSTSLKKGGRGRRGGSRPEMGYKRFVYRVLKQVHPDLGASGRSMEILDMMMADMFERLAEEAARLAKHAGRATLTSREVQSAVRLVLPGELGKHAISEGTKAVTNYMSSSRD